MPRRRPRDARPLAAAATRLPTRGSDRNALARLVKPAAEWQAEAWDYFDSVPEFKYGALWTGNLISKLRLYPAVELADGSIVALDAINPETGESLVPPDVVPPEVSASAVAEMSRLHADLGGQSELQRELAVNLDVAGECYLVGWAARPAGLDGAPAVPESWEVRSLDEVRVKGKDVVVMSGPNDKDGRRVTEDDTVIRCYQRHPRWSSVADCHSRAVLTECRLLQVLSGQMYAEAASRASAGGFTVPNGLTFGRVKADNRPLPEDGDEQAEVPFIEDLTEALTFPIADPADPNSVVPFLIQGEPELLKPDVLRRVEFGRSTGPELDARIEARVQRLARGVNKPVEVLLGHQSTTFANAEQINEDEFTDHIEPVALLLCDVLTYGFLRPNLADTFPTSADAIARVFVWYDADALMDRPNLSDAADEALDRFAVSFDGYRKMKGIPDEYAPSPDELLQIAGLRRGILTAELTAQLLRRVDPSFVPPVLPGAAPADGEEPPLDEAAVDAVIAAAGRTRLLALAGAELLGLNLPALSAGGDPDPPRRPRSA